MYGKYFMDEAKKKSQLLAAVYLQIGNQLDVGWVKKRAFRIAQCSDIWTGKACAICGQVACVHTFGCGDRLCPVCSVRKSRATAAQALEVVPYLSGVPYLITLTQRNVPGEVLGKELTRISHAWRLIIMQRPIQRGVLSWAKTVEITYNPNRMDFHPHVHIIAYLAENETTTMSRAAFWAEKWQQCMNLDYVPMVDVRPLYDREGAVYEVSKYLTKSTTLLSLPDAQRIHSVKYIVLASKDMRFRAYGGDWKRVRRELRLKEAEAMSDQELTEAEQRATKGRECCGQELQDVVMHWSKAGYYVSVSAERKTDDKHVYV